MTKAALTATTPPPIAAEAPPNVILFPSSPAQLAAVAAIVPEQIERLPADQLLAHALAGVTLAHARRGDPHAAGTRQHAVFGAMLALCRVLDEAGYPWEAARTRQAAGERGDAA